MLLGRVSPCLKEEGVEGEEVLRSSEVAESESFVGTSGCKISCPEAVLWATNCPLFRIKVASGYSYFLLDSACIFCCNKILA